MLFVFVVSLSSVCALIIAPEAVLGHSDGVFHCWGVQKRGAVLLRLSCFCCICKDGALLHSMGG